MKKFFVLTTSLILITQLFSQTNVLGVDQLLKNEVKLKSNSFQEKQIAGHLHINKELKLTANQFVEGNKHFLCANPKSNLQKTATQKSKDGRTHHRYQQTWNNIPIEGQYVLLHEENGTLQSINGALVAELSINTLPGLTESQALAKVQQPTVEYAWENADMESELQLVNGNRDATYFPKGKLVIYAGDQTPSSKPNYKLAWKFKLYSIKPHDHVQLIVDAHTGTILQETSLMKHNHVQGNGVTTYNGNNSFTCNHKNHHYELDNAKIETRKYTGSYYGNGQPFSSFDTTWTGDAAALDVHWGTEKFVEFLNTELGRDGYDGNGKKIKALVGYPFQNAFWNGYFLGYGVGDNNTISSPTSIDIVGHEYTHAMLDEIVGFQYGGESGAIEEAYSDIFGELIENYVNGTADWKFGAEITQTNGVHNNLGLRNLANPNLHNSPSVYQGAYWHTSPSDNYGVHTNSSVYSYWFHLVAFGNGSTVNGIGLSPATDLIYETLFYLQPYSDYIDLRSTSVATASNLPQFTPAMIADVEAAWNEVGLGQSSSGTITDIVPGSGATIYAESPTLIKWDTSLSVSTVDLKYSLNGGVSWNDIASNVSYALGEFLWLVPQVYSYSVLIQVSESGNPAVRGTSNGYFTIKNTINLPPVAWYDEIYTTQGFFLEFQPWLNDWDEQSLDINSVSIVTDLLPNVGTTSIFTGGNIRINIDSSFVGVASFLYSICDMGAPVLCDTAEVNLYISKGAKQQWAMDDWGVLNLNDTLSRNLLANDYLLDTSWHFAGWSIINSTHGTITVDSLNGDYVYLPSALGRDKISYIVSNGTIQDTADLHLFVVEDRPLAKDSMDLVILYEMTDGINWANSWDLTTPVSGWHGITKVNNEVQKLELFSNNLSGTVPDFSSLNNLEEINFYDNQLSGSIPDFSNLNNLELINITLTQLTGQLPDFTNLNNLKILNLNGNNLTGPLPDFTNLNNLEQLYLSTNQLSGPLPDFSNLGNLKSLNLENNQLSGPLPDFSNIGNLERLELSANLLVGPLPDFSNLSNLEYLSFNVNPLRGYIPDFSNLPNLETLDVDECLMEGQIPDFSNLSKLKIVKLSYNRFSSTLPNFQYIDSLIKIEAGECGLYGPLPDFSNHKYLESISLDDNQLTGQLPSFSNNDSLIVLDVNNNQLTGPLPSFSNSGKLRTLDLSHNQLTGPLPSFSNLTNLIRLQLNNNQLSGPLPSFSNLTNLSWLHLNDNQLTGDFPDFSNMNNAPWLFLDSNQLTFAGLKVCLSNSHSTYCTPQGIIPVTRSSGSLMVNPGGDITINKYYWNRIEDNSTQFIQGSNYFTPSIEGHYYVWVENDTISDLCFPLNDPLILKSDTIYFQPRCNVSSSPAVSKILCVADSLEARLQEMQFYKWWLNGNIVGTTTKLAVYESGIYILESQDSCLNPVVFDTITITIDTTCIHPGDTNLDGVVNHFDLQNIGLHFGATGPPRTSDPTIFSPIVGGDWAQQTNSGLDLKHVDANGDGIINALDTTIVLLHYGKSWGTYVPPIDSAISPIRIIPEITTVPQGVNGDFTVKYTLENTLNTSINLYGLAFETIIQAPVVMDDQIQIDSFQLPGAPQFLFISESADTNVVQTAFIKTDLLDEVIQDSTTALFSGSLGTEKDLPSGDTVSVIELFVDNIRLTTVNGTMGTGQFDIPIQGVATTILFTENLAFTTTPTTVNCSANGVINIDIIKGTPPYQYQWSNGAITASNTGLATGTYQITVSDALGNSVTAESTVEGIDGIASNPVLVHPTSGQSNGSIALNLTGGSGNYEVQWSANANGMTGATINNLAQGTYTALVEDENACIESFLFELPTDTGVEDPTSHSFHVFPNPSNGLFTVELISAKQLTLNVFDALGRTVHKSEYSNVLEGQKELINLSEFARGIYYIQLQKGDNFYTERIEIH